MISGKIKGSDNPWDNEPNRCVFSYKGYRCIVRRTDLGHLCGYVGLPPDHKYFEKNYDDVPVDCHGGLTFSDFWTARDYGNNIDPSDDDGNWYIGFDAAHAWDLVPYSHLQLPSDLRGGNTYKDMNYMIDEC